MENNSVNEKHIEFSIVKIDGIEEVRKKLNRRKKENLKLLFQYGENTQDVLLRKLCSIDENGNINQTFIIQYIKNQKLSFTLVSTKFNTMLINIDYLLRVYCNRETNINKTINITFTAPNIVKQQKKKKQKKEQQKKVELSLMVCAVGEGDANIIHVDDRPLVVLDDISIQEDMNEDVRNEKEIEEESELESDSFCCGWSWCDISDVDEEEINEFFKNVPTDENDFEKYTGLNLKEWEKKMNDYGGDELHEKNHEWKETIKK